MHRIYIESLLHFSFSGVQLIDMDCEFLEAERIMDYSLLVRLHFLDNNTGDRIGLSPYVLRSGMILSTVRLMLI